MAVVVIATIVRVETKKKQQRYNRPHNNNNNTENVAVTQSPLKIRHLNEINATLVYAKQYAPGTLLAEEAKYPERSYHVPAKIHFIWLGSFIPDKYKNNILTYVKNNRQHEVYLWTDHIASVTPHNVSGIIVRDVQPLHMFNRNLFDSEWNYGHKSDILRYEIVYQEGGIYTDTDSVSVKPFDNRFNRSFVAFISSEGKYIPNGCFGFAKHSNFLLYVVKSLQKNHERPISGRLKYGPPFFTTCFVNYGDNAFNIINQYELIFHSTNSYTYQTMDGSWIEQDEMWWYWIKLYTFLVFIVFCVFFITCIRLKRQRQMKFSNVISQLCAKRYGDERKI